MAILSVAKAYLGGLTIALVAALPAAAQDVARSGMDAPVIAAPADSGRFAPSAARQYSAPEMTGFNSFAASDMAPPPLDNFTPPTLPVVVELFTAQGCSSCPPADAMLETLADDPGILPLSLHVDYWDYLGWADSFASPEFTARQEAYARASGERSVYTPQLIIDGQDTAVAPGPAQLLGLIDAHRASPAMVSLQREQTPDGDRIEIVPLSELGGPIDVVLVRYAPHRTVRIKAGENRDREMTYVNVVLSLDKLADWDGQAPLRLIVRREGLPDDSFPADTRHVILVQEELGGQDMPGPILAAIGLD
ncbi:DUF1223 domain-containing protein [Paracoccus methylarcula]|nr:DUF1223 domain-containing protein [Paracoccus methylarcula]